MEQQQQRIANGRGLAKFPQVSLEKNGTKVALGDSYSPTHHFMHHNHAALQWQEWSSWETPPEQEDYEQLDMTPMMSHSECNIPEQRLSPISFDDIVKDARLSPSSRRASVSNTPHR